MAKMMTDKTHLQKKHLTLKLTSILFLVLAIVFWAIHVPLMKAYISMPGMMISFILSGFFGKKATILGRGLEGEKHTTDLLSKLPSDVYIYNDLKVRSDGRESELDSIVVSPSGVYIIETKNHNGEIIGNAEDKYWTQHKVGRKGTPYQKQMYSPIKQVGTHVYRLSKFFKENNLKIWVDGVVFFSNSEVSVSVRNIGKIPVFTHYESDELLDYVTKGKKVLSEKDINKIVDLLNKL